MSTVVNTYTSTNLGSTSKTLTLTATQAGTTIVVGAALRAASTVYTGISITDNLGNSYVTRKFAGQSGDQRCAAVLDCIGATAGVTSITITPTGGGGRMLGCVAVWEVSSITAFDQGGTGSYSASPLVASCSAQDLGATNFVAAVISAGNNNSAQGISDPPTGYTSAVVQQNDYTSASGEICYRINNSKLTDSASWAIGNGAAAGDPAVIASYSSSAYMLAGVAGSYTTTGGTGTFAAAFTLAGVAGSYFTNGQAGTLTIGPTQTNYVLPGFAGQYVTTGTPMFSDFQIDGVAGSFASVGGMATFGLTIPGGPMLPPTQIYPTGPLNLSDNLDGSIVVAWPPFSPVPDSYNVYVNGVLNQNVNEAPVIGHWDWSSTYPVFGDPRYYMDGTIRAAAQPINFCTITGLQIASYNPSTQVKTDSLTYDIQVVGVIAGAEGGAALDATITPGPTSVMLVTPMRRPFPFPNTDV